MSSAFNKPDRVGLVDNTQDHLLIACFKPSLGGYHLEVGTPAGVGILARVGTPAGLGSPVAGVGSPVAGPGILVAGLGSPAGEQRTLAAGEQRTLAAGLQQLRHPYQDWSQ